ncbi:hypothetical protein ABI582_13390 [Pseudomonas sp. SAS7]|uniref:hypothetical protein n=1 Tax=Pseudomonas sp. SAS7 TaxID=3156487 RepID=UPI003F98E471
MSKHTNYSRGFIISAEPVKSEINNWRTENALGLNFHFDPRVSFDYRIKDGQFCVMLGTALDLDSGDYGTSLVTPTLLDAFITGENTLFEKLDSINGRFLLLYGTYNSDSSSIRMINDATGMRSVFYSTTQPLCISSHPDLVAKQIGASRNDYGKWLTEYSSYHLPGNTTLFHNIKQLVPNHLFDCESNKLIRFFPRESLHTPDDINATIDELAEILKSQAEHLAAHNRILCSITAGVDSRVTLSATRSISRNVKYFTYFGKEGELSKNILPIDKLIATEISSNLGLDHDLIDLSESGRSEASKKLKNEIRTSHVTHSPTVAAEYILRYADQNLLHLRSNLLEIGRIFYKNSYNLPRKLDTKSAVTCYSSRAENDQPVIDIFDQYLNECNYNNIENYDPYDLFYWEYRMGAWHSLVLLESDSAFDTFILFNNRRFLSKLLSIPEPLRQGHDLMLEICARNWPALQFWQINEKTNIYSEFKVASSSFSDAMNLEAAQISSSSSSGTENPTLSIMRSPRSVKFSFVNSAPTIGEMISFKLSISVNEPEDSFLVAHIKTPYANPNIPGRIEYQVLIDGKKLLTADVSAWKDTNQVVIPIHPYHTDAEKAVNFEVRVNCLRNCEPWNWGRAATVIIERISLRKQPALPGTKTICSSNPFAHLEVNT